MSARSFEFFAGDFLTYVGLEDVSVTRYIGDGGIDAHGKLLAGRFALPIGIQVKRHRYNVQRPDIDRFIGALSGRFSEGIFMTTAHYAPTALQKATSSIPRVLTLNGDEIVSIMLEHQLGVKTIPHQSEQFDIDADYFALFEAMKGLLSGRVQEKPSPYHAGSSASDDDSQSIDLHPDEDLITLNALGYALRIDPARVRRWIESESLIPDATQISGGRASYYFRRDRIEHIRTALNLEPRPASTAEWKQAFLDFASSRNLSRSYKPVMVKAFFRVVDRAGTANMDDLVCEFRAIYLQYMQAGQPLERDRSLMAQPLEAGDQEIKRLIVTNPLERFLIKNFMEYDSMQEIVRIAPQLWQALFYYEAMDVLRSAEEQIKYYLSRQ
jgi:hypothetical protein